MIIGFRPNEEDTKRIKKISEFLGNLGDTSIIRFSLKKAVDSIEGRKAQSSILNSLEKKEILEEPSFRLVATTWNMELGENVKTIKRTIPPFEVKYLRESDPEYEKY